MCFYILSILPSSLGLYDFVLLCCYTVSQEPTKLHILEHSGLYDFFPNLANSWLTALHKISSDMSLPWLFSTGYLHSILIGQEPLKTHIYPSIRGSKTCIPVGTIEPCEFRENWGRLWYHELLGAKSVCVTLLYTKRCLRFSLSFKLA